MILDFSDSRYATCRALVERVFEVDLRLPEMVFKKPFGKFCWVEFEEAMTGDFWQCVQQQAAHYLDSFVVVSSSDPEPLPEYGHSGMGVFGSADFAEYEYYLEAGSIPNLNVGIIAKKLFYTGESGRWAFFADREAELIVGAQEDNREWPLTGLRYLSLESAIGIAAMQYCGPLPDEKYTRYIANYGGSRSWPEESYVE